MATILTLNGSPSATSRTGALLRDSSRRLAHEGHDVTSLNVRDLPASDLINARADAPAIAEAIRLLKEAHGVVIGTPIYKAAYTGVLKTFLDLLPQLPSKERRSCRSRRAAAWPTFWHSITGSGRC